jgi:hypothetical protein
MSKKLYLSSKVFTKTSAFLLPVLGISVGLMRENLLINAFLGDHEGKEAPKGDRFIYCLFDFSMEDPVFGEFLEDLQGQSSYVGMYPKEYNKRTMVVFRTPEKWNAVYDFFVEGKYTKIPREYVNQYFKPRLYDGQDKYGISRWKPSKNYMVLTGDKVIRKQIEEDLGVELAEDAEVFSKPNNYEYYGNTAEGYRYF